ncbi:MAG: phosphatidylserine decarboxylase family protein [bacterium]
MKIRQMQTKEKHILSPEGYPVLLYSFLLALALFLFCPYAGTLGFLWVLFCLYFFRNPKRQQPEQKNVVLAPADGTIIRIEDVEEKNFLNKKMKMVSVFMSPFNVHVNRMPLTASIKDAKHIKGRFKAAFADDAPEKNERFATHLQTAEQKDIVMVQVAGWFARRIFNYLESGDHCAQGKIFGVIKFGSRVDLYLPEDYTVTVDLKQKVKAGLTELGRK